MCDQRRHMESMDSIWTPKEEEASLPLAVNVGWCCHLCLRVLSQCCELVGNLEQFLVLRKLPVSRHHSFFFFLVITLNEQSITLKKKSKFSKVCKRYKQVVLRMAVKHRTNASHQHPKDYKLEGVQMATVRKQIETWCWQGSKGTCKSKLVSMKMINASNGS